MSQISRRGFVAGSMAAGAALALPFSRAYGANEQIRVAVIGLLGRGGSHLGGFKDHVVAVCDCDEDVLNKKGEEFDKHVGRKVDRIVDYRKLLERDDIDCISIATPNHTHAIMSIEAAQAGKDIYCEKPVSHNVWEGRQIVHAADKYNKIIQCGTQSRSSPSLHEAVEYVRSGKLGKILHAVGTCYKPRKGIGKLDKPLNIPATVDYDLWCGPADKVDLYRPKLHYDWHWDYNTGAGDMGNQGIHQMDIARWFLGEAKIAPRTISIGGRVGYDDAGNTANTQIVYHDYEAAPLIFETRGLPKSKEAQKNWGGSMDNYRGSQIGVIVQCENGYVVIPSYTQATAFDNDGKQLQSWNGGGDHYANFLKAVKSRKRTDLNADIVEGHISSALCHTGNISHMVGGPATADEIASTVRSNDLLADSFDRMAKHLRANEIDIDASTLTLGPWVEFDVDKEVATNNSDANQYVKREGRKPFVVPTVG